MLAQAVEHRTGECARISRWAKGDMDQLLRLWHCETSKEESVNQRENRYVGSCPQRQDCQSDQREPRSLAEHAQPITKIGKKTVDGKPLPRSAAVFFNQSHVAKLAPGSTLGFFRGHAARNEFRCLFFEVSANLFRKVVVDPLPQEPLPQPLHNSPGARTRAIPSSIHSNRDTSCC